MEYSELLWAKTLKWSRMYEENVLKGKLIKALQESLRHRLHSFWCLSNHTTMQDLVQHSTSLTNLGSGSHVEEGMYRSGNHWNPRDNI